MLLRLLLDCGIECDIFFFSIGVFFDGFLFSRPHFQRKDLFAIRPSGFQNEGVWKPTGINSCLKISKYERWQSFKKHKDGAFVKNENERR